MSIKVKKAFIYFILILVIIQSYSIHFFKYYRVARHMEWVTYIGVMALILLTRLENRRTNDKKLDRLNNKGLLCIVLYLIFITTLAILQPHFAKQVARYYIIQFLAAYLLIGVCLENKINVFKCISNIISVHTSLNLFLYVIFSLMKILPAKSTYYAYDINNILYNGYYNIYFDSHYYTIGGVQLVRNNGGFSEPGVFVIFLVLGVIIELFMAEKKSKLRIIIFTLGVISTFSATGYITLLGVIGLKTIINISSKSRLSNVIKFGIIPATFSVVAYSINKVFEYKAFEISTGSFINRSQDWYFGFLLFKEKPLIGWGITNLEVMLNMHDISRGHDFGLYSNGMSALLYQGGIYICLLYLFNFVTITWMYKKNNNFWGGFVLASFFIIELVVFPFQYSLLGMIFLAYGMSLVSAQGKETN